jgi:hypothetical protein
MHFDDAAGADDSTSSFEPVQMAPRWRELRALVYGEQDEGQDDA